MKTEQNPQPTTVRGWLETLPELENEPSRELSAGARDCGSLADALAMLARYSTKGITAKRWWKGAEARMLNEPFEPFEWKAWQAGYNTMSDYLQRQKAGIVPEVSFCPKCENTLPDECFDRGAFFCKECVAASLTVSYIPVAPDDYEALCKKANAYDFLKGVVSRMSDEIEDLKKLFV